MPAGDRRGPRGMGPMTGRGMGFCAGYQTPGFVNQGPGMGAGGWGRGGGRGAGRGVGRGGHGSRNMFYATGLTGWQRAGYGTQPFQAPVAEFSAGQELDVLKEQAGYLANSLEGINQRIAELEEKAGK